MAKIYQCVICQKISKLTTTGVNWDEFSGEFPDAEKLVCPKCTKNVFGNIIFIKKHRLEKLKKAAEKILKKQETKERIPASLNREELLIFN